IAPLFGLGGFRSPDLVWVGARRFASNRPLSRSSAVALLTVSRLVGGDWRASADLSTRAVRGRSERDHQRIQPVCPVFSGRECSTRCQNFIKRRPWDRSTVCYLSCSR